MIQAIIFDGDDTLWHTEWLYDEARQRAREITEAAGLNGENWEARERVIDVDNVVRFGHGSDRFPASCVEAYEEACTAVGKDVDQDVQSDIDTAARSVFTRPAPLVEGVEEILAALRSRGILLALLTKGDPTVQRLRIKQSGLADMFDLIEIVERKEPDSIAGLLGQLGVAPAAALTVGNSLRSDVLPSIAADVTPVWIDAHVWEYERQHAEIPVGKKVIKRKDLSGLLEITQL